MVGIFLFSVAGLTACAQRAATTPTTEPAPAVTEEKTATQEKEVVTKEKPPPTQEAAPQQTPTPQQEPTSTKVDISGFAFAPATITIAVGTAVTWTNNDSVAHTVSNPNNLFDSGSLSRGSTFSYTFNQSGTFEYHCQIHPSMTAKVIVGEQQTAPTEENPLPEGNTYSY